MFDHVGNLPDGLGEPCFDKLEAMFALVLVHALIIKKFKKPQGNLSFKFKSS